MATETTIDEVQTYMRCPHERHVRYGLRVVPVGAAVPTLDQVVRAALPALFGKDPAVGATGAQGANHPACVRARTGTPDAADGARAAALVSAYAQRWKGDWLTLLAVGQTGRLGRTGLPCKVDVIARDASGRTIALAHRTTLDPLTDDSPIWPRLRATFDASTIFAAALSLGFELDAVIFDVVRRPSERPLSATPAEDRYKKDGGLKANAREQGETPAEFEARVAAKIASATDAYFRRYEVARDDQRVREQLADLENWQDFLEASLVDGPGHVPSPRNPQACRRLRGPCDYLDACAGLVSLSDPARFRVLAGDAERAEAA